MILLIEVYDKLKWVMRDGYGHGEFIIPTSYNVIYMGLMPSLF